MKNLQLSLIEVWFKLTESLIKKEDYRNITPYWCNRFLLYEDNPKSVKWWAFMENYEGCFFMKALLNNIELGIITFKHFDYNIMTLGYPKSTDTRKILKLEHKGIEIGYGNPEWGAEPNKLYFIIKHGEIIK